MNYGKIVYGASWQSLTTFLYLKWREVGEEPGEQLEIKYSSAILPLSWDDAERLAKINNLQGRREEFKKMGLYNTRFEKSAIRLFCRCVAEGRIKRPRASAAAEEIKSGDCIYKHIYKHMLASYPNRPAQKLADFEEMGGGFQ